MNRFYSYNKNLKQLSRDLRNSSTLSEIILWTEVLKARKLGYQFHRQRPLAKFICDFFCKDLKLIIELDGATHLDKSVEMKDKLKEKRLKLLGYTVLRFKDEEVLYSLEDVIKKIENCISEYEKMHPEIVLKKVRRRRS